ncbi:MAG: cytochrome c peroxidase [Chitinophagales bacterium]|jgi:cytochrome c peroxidase
MRKSVFAVLISAFLLAFHEGGESTTYIPHDWPETQYDFENNPLTEEKIFLGRVLFYDPKFSRDGMISCASCHSPYNAFTHVDHALSHGVFDSIGTRNSPALMNLAWQASFMWDGAINHLDMQALAPISHPDEMASSISEVVDYLNQTDHYRSLYFQAFQDSAATGELTLKALSQFMLTMVSSSSKYDQVKNDIASFNLQELAGYGLFKTHCNSCHQEPLFSTFKFASNGLPVDTILNDLGRFKITNDSSHLYQFKIPSLRNLAYSFPYMHDGRFKSITEIINHYTTEKEANLNLAPELQKPVELTANEKIDLTAFLLTLTDSSFVFNKAFNYPRDFYLNLKKD